MTERPHMSFDFQPTFFLFLLQSEVLGEVVLNGRDDRLKLTSTQVYMKTTFLPVTCEKPKRESGQQKYENAAVGINSL